eukprot:jgi/Botrbrau1/1711/Bobra.116_2s0053.1
MELDDSSDTELASIASSSHSSPLAPRGLFTPFLSSVASQKRGRIIAVPIIDSEVSLKAVRHAAKLVLDDPDGGRLLLLHVINICTSPRSPKRLQQLSQHLLERAEVPREVPARVILTFMMHAHADDKESIALALCKKAELLGCTDICMVETNGIPHLPIIVGAIAKSVVHSSRIPVTLIKASNKGEKPPAQSHDSPTWQQASKPSPVLKAFSSRMQGLLTQRSEPLYQPIPIG